MKRVLLLVCALSVLSATPQSGSAGQSPSPRRQQTVDIAAERFSFTPSEVKTTVGTTLTIRLTSDDTAHGFRIIGTDVNIEIPKRGRGTTTVTFTPEVAGEYTFECAKLCGAGHSFMRGAIVVEEAAASAGTASGHAARTASAR
jgi:cytochrome c oxidase subunit 2